MTVFDDAAAARRNASLYDDWQRHEAEALDRMDREAAAEAAEA